MIPNIYEQYSKEGKLQALLSIFKLSDATTSTIINDLIQELRKYVLNLSYLNDNFKTILIEDYNIKKDFSFN